MRPSINTVHTEGAEASADGIDPAGLLPASLAYWTYEGSLTSPPCSENVDWMIARTPVDSWATLKDARAGRALFQVPGGLLVFNLERALQRAMGWETAP